MKKLLFIFNPRSGRGQIRACLPEILDIMVKSGFDVTVHTTQSQGDAISVTRDRAHKFDRIVCSGGDGTLDEVVSGMMQSDVRIPIGYIPAGSTNDFGNSLGIDKDMTRAAEIAVHGVPFPVDIGSFNDRYFVYVAAFGIFTEVSYSTPQDMKNNLGHLAYILEGAKQLRDVPSYRMQVEYDGNVMYDEFIYGMISNSNSIGGFRQMVPKNVSLNDGLFEVTLIRMPKNPIELADVINCLQTGRRDSDMLYSFQTSGIRLTSSEEVSWTLDGEFGGTQSTSEIRLCHKALEIMVEA
ncbi:MAG: YegS/Rv2252/BmrU family lipid kinase [Lachnospiraceae bacterium]|jgi:YegS/Rv2252/BmrU family lipid kinase|nr:YegS/Rv2252/BmrU family lipid kinase [Lachnospiraceae bacterium]